MKHVVFVCHAWRDSDHLVPERWWWFSYLWGSFLFLCVSCREMHKSMGSIISANLVQSCLRILLCCDLDVNVHLYFRVVNTPFFFAVRIVIWITSLSALSWLMVLGLSISLPLPLHPLSSQMAVKRIYYVFLCKRLCNFLESNCVLANCFRSSRGHFFFLFKLFCSSKVELFLWGFPNMLFALYRFN